MIDFTQKNLHLRVSQLTCHILYLGERFIVIGWVPRWSLPKDKMKKKKKEKKTE